MLQQVQQNEQNIKTEEEKKIIKEQEQQFDKQRQAEFEEERIADLKEKVNKTSSFIPITFYIRIVIGFILIIALPLIYTIVAVLASVQTTRHNHVLFLSGYRTTLMMIMASLACNMAVV
ncbi:MAG: hypothetical protein EZS28_020714, partial [Streblomastix strix]